MLIKNINDLWEALSANLLPGQQIPNWTKDNGYFHQPIKIMEFNNALILVKSSTAKNIQKITKMEVEKVAKRWNEYITGKLSRSEFRLNTRYSRYLIDLLHYLDEKGFQIEIE